MAVLKTDAIDKALTKKGFVKNERDHHLYIYYNNGQKTAINTKISHGKKEIYDDLILAMARQVRLSKRDFMKLIQCTLDANSYKQILVNNKMI